MDVPRNAIHVATGHGGVIAIDELQAEGRRPIAAREFLAGRPVRLVGGSPISNRRHVSFGASRLATRLPLDDDTGSQGVFRFESLRRSPSDAIEQPVDSMVAADVRMRQCFERVL